MMRGMRGGPHRWVRHPGYVGSLVRLHGVAPASGHGATGVASLLATSAADTYRIRVKYEMLVSAPG